MLRSQLLASLAGAASATWEPVGSATSRTRVDAPYRDASHHIDAIVDGDRADPRIAPAGRSRFYHHGHRVKNVVVLLHGFTNCPQQFDEFAVRLFRSGCNVYVPRIAFHGYRDRLTMALASLTVDGLSAMTNAYFASARSLGDRVTVLGLSLGGAMALALAQSVPVDHAIAVAPFLMPIGIPSVIGLPAMSALDRLPDEYVWWDPRVRENCRLLYAYPGFPTHALATLVFFADTVARAANVSPPRGRHCTLVTNSNESAVNNGTALDLIRRWNVSGAAYSAVSLTDLGAPRHDIIDPTTFPDARTLVYPKLQALIERP